MLVNKRFMFPLKLINQSIGDGYFMTSDGKIWSTRASASGVELTGSKTRSGTYFKFGNHLGTGFKHTDLVRAAMAHPKWRSETTGPVQLTGDSTDRAHADTVENGIKGKGSIIGRVHNGRLVFGHDPKIHMTEASAKAEMERLAKEHPGIKFVRLAIVGTVISGGMLWE